MEYLIPVMFCGSSGAASRRRGDVAVREAGLTHVAMASLGRPLAVLRRRAENDREKSEGLVAGGYSQ